MYTGENQTAIRSMQWLEAALLKLLETEKYAKITVKDICREADLSRQTFYQMFDSKDELMEYHFSNLFAGFREGCGSLDDIGCNELACQFFHFFYDERAFVRLLIENNMTYLLEKEFERYLPQIALFRRINETEAYPDYSLAYVAGALTATYTFLRVTITSPLSTARRIQREGRRCFSLSLLPQPSLTINLTTP